MSHGDFVPVALDHLPSTPGVLMVCCPQGLNAKVSRILAVVPCENCREEAGTRSLVWATECTTGYLEYLVAEVTDPKNVEAAYLAASQRYPVGSTYSRS